jgi:hypothetical protein
MIEAGVARWRGPTRSGPSECKNVMPKYLLQAAVIKRMHVRFQHKKDSVTSVRRYCAAIAIDDNRLPIRATYPAVFVHRFDEGCPGTGG